MNDKFSDFQSALVAFTGFLSVSLFMIWEVFQMLLNLQELRERRALANNILEYGDINGQMAAISAVDARYLKIRVRVWIVVFVLTVVTALTGALTMLVGISWELMPGAQSAPADPSRLEKVHPG